MFVAIFFLTICLAKADLVWGFSGEENDDEVSWEASGSLTIATATTYGPLNDSAWLFPDGGEGWAFFSDDGSGDDIVEKGITVSAGPEGFGEFDWIIKDSEGGAELSRITVKITGWLILPLRQSIEPRTEPYTIPNLEEGQVLCLEGAGRFILNYDSLNGVPGTLGTVFDDGTYTRIANGGLIDQVVKIIRDTSYEEYRASAFPEGADPNKTGPNDDFDGDGIPNFLEYASANSVTKKSEGPITFFRGTKVIILFPVRTNDPSLVFEIEYSETLLDFGSVKFMDNLTYSGEFFPESPAPFKFTATKIDGERTLISCCYTGPAPALYFKLKVSQSE